MERAAPSVARVSAGADRPGLPGGDRRQLLGVGLLRPDEGRSHGGDDVWLSAGGDAISPGTGDRGLSAVGRDLRGRRPAPAAGAAGAIGARGDAGRAAGSARRGGGDGRGGRLRLGGRDGALGGSALYRDRPARRDRLRADPWGGRRAASLALPVL